MAGPATSVPHCSCQGRWDPSSPRMRTKLVEIMSPREQAAAGHCVLQVQDPAGMVPLGLG